MTKKVKLLAIVERGKGKRNFACWVKEDIDKCGLAGYGGTSREAIEDLYVCLREYKEEFVKAGKEFPDVEFDFRFDVGSFFDYYPIDITAFAKYIGMNASALRQYVTCIRYPKKDTIQRIRKGIDMLSEDLGTNLMVEKPTVDYAG